MGLSVLLHHNPNSTTQHLFPMYTTDYKKELALKSEKRVPTALAFVLIAAFSVSLWYGYQTLKPHYVIEDAAASGE